MPQIGGKGSCSAAQLQKAAPVFPAHMHWVLLRSLVEAAESSLHDPSIGKLVRSCAPRLMLTGMHLQRTAKPWSS